MISKPNRSFSSTTLANARWRRTGAAMVEFAVIAPVMFAVVLGIVEFGRAFMVSNLITNAARDGARSAVVSGSTNATVKTKVETLLQQTAGVNAADVTITITVDNAEAANEVGNAKAGDQCTVKIEIPFSKVQYIAAKFLDGKSLTSQVTMRRE